jgi:hypothetical protein
MGTCSASFNTCNLSGPNTCPGAPVETCDEEIPQIVDYLNLSASGIDPNKEAFCTNGLTSGGFQTAAIGAKPKVLSDFDCYQADSTFSGAATVADMFLGAVPVSVQVGSAQRLCAPAVKVPDNMTPAGTLPTEHLVGYEITSTLRVSVPGVTVHSPQFGTFTVNVTKVAGKAALLVPSNKTVKPNPPPPQDTNTTNHFLCYNFDTVTGGIPGQVMVRDQFNPDPTTKKPQIVTFTKQKSWRLCVPVNKNGLDPTAPNNRNGLLCLVTGPDMQSPLNNTFVNWSNQFQHPATNVHPDKLDDFCVPVTVTP